jgi:predicted enzyme related to lactoylglutathione lyase
MIRCEKQTKKTMETGLVIYSLNLDNLVSFYQEAFGFTVSEREDGLPY